MTTQSVYLTVELRVPHIPREGHNLHASGAESVPGGGFIGAAAARAQGVEAVCASPLGTGPNSHAIRRRMGDLGITAVQGAVVGDVGVGVSLIQGDGKMATVVAAGVEGETSAELLDLVEAQGGDVVLVHGSDLAVEGSAGVLAKWVPTLPEDVTVVVATSPAVDSVPAHVWLPILRRADVLTMNTREDGALRETLRNELPGTELDDILKPTAACVRRSGPLGCEVTESRGAPTVHVPSYEVAQVDTTGVGDTHVAVMCAALLQGDGLYRACQRANAAGSVTVSRSGSLPPPSREQVDRLVASGATTGTA